MAMGKFADVFANPMSLILYLLPARRQDNKTRQQVFGSDQTLGLNLFRLYFSASVDVRFPSFDFDLAPGGRRTRTCGLGLAEPSRWTCRIDGLDLGVPANPANSDDLHHGHPRTESPLPAARRPRSPKASQKHKATQNHKATRGEFTKRSSNFFISCRRRGSHPPLSRVIHIWIHKTPSHRPSQNTQIVPFYCIFLIYHMEVSNAKTAQYRAVCRPRSSRWNRSIANRIL